jgi:hypothetical protein
VTAAIAATGPDRRSIVGRRCDEGYGTRAPAAGRIRACFSPPALPLRRISG